MPSAETVSAYDQNAPQPAGLGKRILYPNVRTWQDLFCGAADANSPSAVQPYAVPTVQPYAVTGRGRQAPMLIGGFATLDLAKLGYPAAMRQAYVQPYATVCAGIAAATVAVERDRMTWRFVPSTEGQVLVICEHSLILGSVWVARIDPATIPAWLRGAPAIVP